MRTACFIPIKAYSERVPGKNFRVLHGKKLYEYICEHVAEAKAFDDVYVDTNSIELTLPLVLNVFRIFKPTLLWGMRTCIG